MGIFDGLRARRHAMRVRVESRGVQVCSLDTAALYRSQPNLRAVVGYLADNAAQVPLKVHDRRANDDRPRVLDSPAALLLQHPNADMTAFEMKRAIYSDLYLYGKCLVLVLPDSGAESGWQMRHVPATWVHDYIGRDPFAPEAVQVVNPQGESAGIEVPRDRFILFHGYDPEDPMAGGDPVKALKDVLHEQVESNGFRRQMWQRGGRFNAYVKRPKDVEKWSDEAFDRFKETFKASWAGDAASEGGGMPILEDGMEIAQLQFNSRDAQWSEAKKLGREDVAGVYHVNPALIWPGDGQTYASAKDNARALYNDTLAPMLMQVTDRINAFLLPMVGEDASHYVAYDITIKTEGTFEEKVAALQAATGAPILTRNEARAKLDLPAIDGADELIVPLNVVEGGLASPYDADPTVERYAGEPRTKDAGASYKAAPRSEQEDALAEVYRRFFRRQREAVLPKLGASKAKADSDWWDAERWDRELSDDLMPVALSQATDAAQGAADGLGLDFSAYSVDRTEGFVRSMCDARARWVNKATKDDLDEVDGWEGDEGDMHASYGGVFDYAEEDRASTAGAALAAAVAGFGALECAKQLGGGRKITKTWVVTSGNPRKSHARMDGETVPHHEEFSNGAQWPGDSALDAADVANCRCVVQLDIER